MRLSLSLSAYPVDFAFIKFVKKLRSTNFTSLISALASFPSLLLLDVEDKLSHCNNKEREKIIL